MSGAATAVMAAHELVEDEDRWKMAQEGLTTVQMAVGLKPKLDDEGEQSKRSNRILD